MRPFRFSKPKNPGFGLSSEFYLSVLCGTASLPEPRSFVAPGGAGGAVPGFFVPATPGKDKSFLDRPLERGAYGAVSPDKTTVLRVLAMSKEEAGFDPGAFMASQRALELSPEMASRISATWTLVQLSFQSHHPMVYPALDFLQDVAGRIASLTDGLVADPLADRYLLPEGLRVAPRSNPEFDVREHVSVRLVRQTGKVSAGTRGLRKFAFPELEIVGLDEEDAGLAERFLLSIGQTQMAGRLAQLGDKVGARTQPFQIAVGGLDRAVWDGIACWELLPPTGVAPAEALRIWAEETRQP